MKDKRLKILFLVLISSFLLFIYIYNNEYNYNYEYIVNDLVIQEMYSMDEGSFYYNINDEFIFQIEGEYSTNRGLIEDLYIEDDCLYIEGDLNFFDFCKSDLYYFLEDSVIYNSEYVTYNNIEFSKNLSNNIFIWNYNGYIFYSDGEIKQYDLFENDVYKPSLIYQMGQYLVLPDYDQSYYFDGYYLIDMSTGKYSYINLDTEINFDLYYLSYEESTLSIYDKKNNKVYTLNILKGKTSIKNNVTYSDKELESFSYSLSYNFYLEDDELYYKYGEFMMYIKKVELSNIIYQNNNSIYFLDNGVLAYYELGSNIITAATYNEWLFNYEYQIFIY